MHINLTGGKMRGHKKQKVILGTVKDIKTVLDLVKLHPQHDGNIVYLNVPNKKTQIRVDLKNLMIYKSKGIACEECGIKGTHFKLETPDPGTKIYRLVLYTIIDRKEYKMTRDHVVPAWFGGTNSLKNLQILCQPCNNRKSGLFISPDGLLVPPKFDFRKTRNYGN